MVKQHPLNLEKQKKKRMIALITYGFKKEQQNTIKYLFVYFHICCICYPCFHMFLNVAIKIRTLSYVKKSQLNSVAS